MAEWWSIEVFHGEFPAGQWRDTCSSMLIESALSNGASDWVWHEHPWGVVFEVVFAGDEEWRSFRRLPAVQAALDAVPDPVDGLLVYRGRGGGAVHAAHALPRERGPWPCRSRAASGGSTSPSPHHPVRPAWMRPADRRQTPLGAPK